MNFNEYDTVRVLINTEVDIKKGDIGVVIMVYEDPIEGYEVEFINEDGTQKAQIVFKADEIEKVE